MVWWATEQAGDFTFFNDPDRLMAWAAWLVACFSATAFVLETILSSCGVGGSVRFYMRYVLALHIMMEDGFQMLLYTLVSSSQAQDDVSLSAGLGVLQCILFFFIKLREVWTVKEQTDRQQTQDTVMQEPASGRVALL